MALISLQEISLAFGGPILFEKISFQIEPGERIALLGRNGMGKTTLMKVIAGQIEIDTGKIVFQKDVRVTHLPQEVPIGLSGKVADVVLSGLGKQARTLSEYNAILNKLNSESSDQLLRELDQLQTELDHTGGWDLNNKVDQILTEVKIDGELDFESLSGGQKRRVLLAKALILEPDVLLLDEPTNHLDIESIQWLENLIKEFKGTIFFVTHDRTFMKNLATRILELDRGKIFNWTCNYETFLERKKMALENEAVQKALFDKKLAEEEIWIRKGVKARRTRNEGRVRALKKLREEKKSQRKEIGQVRMQAQESSLSGDLVIRADKVYFDYDDKIIIQNFTTQIMRGDKIGIIGPNGSGKTTLLRILLGQIKPNQGNVKLGTNLAISYYDQLREQIEEDKNVIDNVSPGTDSITINGKSRHIISYLQDFLFTPDRARTPVNILSGGERNRLFLARLFTKPSNVLVMDEPTNDLDIETQELLEELLMEYSGTLLLVSHDRTFLNNVVTSSFVLEGKGLINEYPGGYDDWLEQRKLVLETNSKSEIKSENSTAKKQTERSPNQKKMSFQEKHEMEKLPETINKLEKEQEILLGELASSNLYKSEPKLISEKKIRSEQLVKELDTLYKRWEYLTELSELN